MWYCALLVSELKLKSLISDVPRSDNGHTRQTRKQNITHVTEWYWTALYPSYYTHTSIKFKRSCNLRICDSFYFLTIQSVQSKVNRYIWVTLWAHHVSYRVLYVVSVVLQKSSTYESMETSMCLYVIFPLNKCILEKDIHLLSLMTYIFCFVLKTLVRVLTTQL